MVVETRDSSKRGLRRLLVALYVFAELWFEVRHRFGGARDEAAGTWHPGARERDRRRQLRLAFDDFAGGAQRWRLVTLLAWQDIKQRYRRSTLGPLWVTLNMAISVLIMTCLVTWLFHSDYSKNFPFICAGLVYWGLFSGIFVEGAATFLGAQRFFLQIRHPFSVYIGQTVWRNILLFAHNFVIYIIVAVVYAVMPSAEAMWFWPLGMLLDIMCVTWMALLAAVVATRFRDLPMILTNLMNVAFWLTPILYREEQLGNKRIILELNPFTHILALAREPLLGEVPALRHWVAVIAMIVVGWVGTILFFARFRSRIAYWL